MRRCRATRAHALVSNRSCCYSCRTATEAPTDCLACPSARGLHRLGQNSLIDTRRAEIVGRNSRGTLSSRADRTAVCIPAAVERMNVAPLHARSRWEFRSASGYVSGGRCTPSTAALSTSYWSWLVQNPISRNMGTNLAPAICSKEIPPDSISQRCLQSTRRG